MNKALYKRRNYYFKYWLYSKKEGHKKVRKSNKNLCKMSIDSFEQIEYNDYSKIKGDEK